MEEFSAFIQSLGFWQWLGFLTLAGLLRGNIITFKMPLGAIKMMRDVLREEFRRD